MTNLADMIQFGSDTSLPRRGHMGGGDSDYTIACTVPSPNMIPSSPESLDERYVENVAPRLEIVEQPVSKFRFRYITEMNGPHGCLAGASAKSTNQKTYPTVRLHNYFREDAIIRCSLYTTDRSRPMPHAHALTKDNRKKEELHVKSVHAQNNYTAEFPGLGILHVPQKELLPKLYEKLLTAYEEKFRREFGSDPRQLEILRKQVRQRSEEEARCMDKNQVALFFEAFRRDETGMLIPLCYPVLSNPIQNKKSTTTNDLNICRIDKIEGSCTGGDEIYLLVEKVSKKNIQVHFVDKKSGWRAKAEFTQADVHHQFAIVCRTPPYQSQDITSEVQVQIELYRPSDEATSRSHTFTYKPAQFPNRKRPRTENWNRANATRETYYNKQKPTFGVQYKTEGPFETTYLNVVANELSPEDFYDFERTYATSCGRSTSLSSDNGDSTITDTEDHSLERLYKDFDTQSVLFEPDNTPIVADLHDLGDLGVDGVEPAIRLKGNKTPNTVEKSRHVSEVSQNSKTQSGNQLLEDSTVDVEKMAKRIADIQIQDDGTASQKCFEYTKRSNKCMKLVMNIRDELFEAAKEEALLFLAARNDRADLKRLLAMGVRDVNLRDESGATALHWAVRCRSLDCVRELLKSSDIDLNATDSDSRTPLHIAVDQDDSAATEALIKAGADVTIPNGKTGDTVLHTAVKWKQISIIIQLLQTGKFSLDEENYHQVSVKTLVAQSDDQSLHTLFTFAPNTCVLDDDTSSDESSSDESDVCEDESSHSEAIG